MTALPLISFAKLSDSSSHAATAGEMRAAGIRTGFFCIVDHGLRKGLIEEVLEVSKRFFALPLVEKEKVRRDAWTQRGWDQLSNQSFGDTGEALEKGVDLKEGMQIGKDGVDDKSEYWGRYAHGANLLPSEEVLPGLRRIMAEYYDAMHALGKQVMQLFAVSLDLPTDFFDEVCRTPISALRLLRYPPQARPGDSVVGAGAHRDFGVGTLLVTSGVSGLQLWMDDKWNTVEPPKGGIVFNIGDLGSMMMPEYRSSLHRVVNLSGVERFSVPFFLDGNSDWEVKAYTSGPEVKGVRVEDHMRERFDTSYGAVEPETAVMNKGLFQLFRAPREPQGRQTDTTQDPVPPPPPSADIHRPVQLATCRLYLVGRCSHSRPRQMDSSMPLGKL